MSISIIEDTSPHFEWEEFTVPLAVAIYDSPTVFSREILGINPHDYQVELLEDHADRIIVCWGRQLGKTFTLALYALWFSMTRSNKLTVILAPSSRQSKIMYNEIRRLITNTPVLKAACKKLTETEIIFSNGSRILPVTVGDKKGVSLKGEAIDLLLIDEFAIMQHDKETWGNVNPTTASTHGKIIIISTPKTKSGLFYVFFMLAKGEKNEITEKYTGKLKPENIPSWSLANAGLLEDLQVDNGLPSMYGFYFIREDTGLPQISRRVVMDARVTMTDIQFKQEYCAMFLEEELSFFNSSELDYSQRYPYNYQHEYFENDCYLGVDWGGSKDSTVMTVVTREKIPVLFKNDYLIRVVNRWEFKPSDYAKGECNHAAELKFIENHILPNYNIIGIYTDKTGIGYEASRQLDEMCEFSGIFVGRISLQQVPKFNMMARVKILMQQGRFLYPKSDGVMRQQFLNVQLKYSPILKRESLYCSESLHDDHPTGVAVACCGIEDPGSHETAFAKTKEKIRGYTERSTEYTNTIEVGMGSLKMSRKRSKGSSGISTRGKRKARNLRELW